MRSKIAKQIKKEGKKEKEKKEREAKTISLTER